VDRAVSAYSWYVRVATLPNVDLETGIGRVVAAAEGDTSLPEHASYRDIFERGCYDVQLRRWLEYFPADRFLVLLYDTIVERPHEALARAYAFCGVDPTVMPDAFSRRPKVNTGNLLTMMVERWFPVRRGRRLSLPARAVRKTVHRINELLVRFRLAKRPALTPQTRRRLADAYESHVRDLQSLLRGVTVVNADIVDDLVTRWR